MLVRKLYVHALLFICFSYQLFAQPSTNIDKSLQKLELNLNNMLNESEKQKKLIEDLNLQLMTQEILSTDLNNQLIVLQEQSENVYKSLVVSEKKLGIYKKCTMIFISTTVVMTLVHLIEVIR